MFMKQEQVLDHQKKFWESMVDLKVDGWKAFSDAFNSYTMGFYKKSLEQIDEQVEKLATTMKGG